MDGGIFGICIPFDTATILCAESTENSESSAKGVRSGKTTIQIFKLGVFKGHHMAGFEITEAIVAEIVSNFNARANKQVPIDFEHASEALPWMGDIAVNGAPATGWITSLENRGSEGLFANCELLDPGLAYVQGKRYKFFSPAFTLNHIDGESGVNKGAALLSGALTNKPFFDGMAEVTASRNLKGDSTMNSTMILAQLAILCGVKSFDSIESALASVTSMRDKNAELEKLCEDQGKRLKEIEVAQATSEVEALIKSGVFSASSKDKMVLLCVNQPAVFAEVVASVNAAASRVSREVESKLSAPITASASIITDHTHESNRNPSNELIIQARKLSESNPAKYGKQGSSTPNSLAYRDAAKFVSQIK